MRYALLITLLWIAVKPSFSQVVQTINVPASQDATVWFLTNQTNPQYGATQNNNYGTTPSFTALEWTWSGSPGRQYGFMDFELPSCAYTEVIDSAKLHLFGYPNHWVGHSQLSGSNECEIKRVTQNWGELTITWNNQPPTTNVNQVLLAASTSNTQNYTLDMSAMVQDMINNPATSYGIRISMTTPQFYRAMTFCSREHTDSTLHPYLELFIHVPEDSLQGTGFPLCASAADSGVISTVQPLGPGMYDWSQSAGPPAGWLPAAGDSVYTTGISTNKTPGSYEMTLFHTGADGCQTYGAYSFNVLNSPIDTITWVMCSGDSVFTANSWKYTSGIFYDTLQASSGCDSILVSDITATPAFLTQLTVSLCAGDSVFAGGNWQYASGVFTDTLSSMQGCDSILETTINLANPSSALISIDLCTSDSVLINGVWISSPGNYYDTLTNAAGCDSLLSYQVQGGASSITQVSTTICPEDSLFLANNWQNTAGIYQDTLTGVGGCDSIIQTSLSIYLLTNNSVQYSICPGDSILINGNWEFTQGQYTDTTTSAQGCDSITQISVILNQVPGALDLDTVFCEDDPLEVWVPPGNYTVLWSNNTIGEVAVYNEGGNYWVERTGVCGTFRDYFTLSQKICDYYFYVPNAFTPNGDGHNDLFSVYGEGLENVVDFQLRIFDRWGHLVFETDDPYVSWTGEINGKVKSDVYIWQIGFTYDVTRSYSNTGHIILLK